MKVIITILNNIYKDIQIFRVQISWVHDITSVALAPVHLFSIVLLCLRSICLLRIVRTSLHLICANTVNFKYKALVIDAIIAQCCANYNSMLVNTFLGLFLLVNNFTKSIE